MRKLVFVMLAVLYIAISFAIFGCNNDETPTSPKNPSYALQFDGVDGYVIFKNSESLNPINAITISMWLNLSTDIDCDENNNWRVLLYKGWSWFEFTGYDVVLGEDRKLSWDVATVGGALRYRSSVTLPVGQWTFATFVYSSSTSQAKIYFNGKEIPAKYSSVGAGNIQPNLDDLRLNKLSNVCPTVAGNFPGLVDEIRIWNIALTQEQIQENMNYTLTGNETGLISYWRFDEGSGTTAFDLTSNNNNGILHGGVTWVPSTAPISYR